MFLDYCLKIGVSKSGRSLEITLIEFEFSVILNSSVHFLCLCLNSQRYVSKA